MIIFVVSDTRILELVILVRQSESYPTRIANFRKFAELLFFGANTWSLKMPIFWYFNKVFWQRSSSNTSWKVPIQTNIDQ